MAAKRTAPAERMIRKLVPPLRAVLAELRARPLGNVSEARMQGFARAVDAIVEAYKLDEDFLHEIYLPSGET